MIDGCSRRASQEFPRGHLSSSPVDESWQVGPNHAFNRTPRYGASIRSTSVAEAGLTWRRLLSGRQAVVPRFRFGSIALIAKLLLPVGRGWS